MSDERGGWPSRREEPPADARWSEGEAGRDGPVGDTGETGDEARPGDEGETRPRSRASLRRRGATGLLVLALVGGAVLTSVLADQQAEGPPHVDVVVGDGVPATLYVPGELPEEGDAQLPDPGPPGERPPLVVVAHGFSGDRVMMSSFSRRVASAGYGVLAIDFRGHGENRNGFGAGRDGLLDDLRDAVDWAEDEPHVDASRLALVGHSMGADAALRFAQRDRRPDATIAISGGESLEGPRRPKNLLLLVASRDPGSIKEGASRVGDVLAGGELERGRVAGNTADGTAVARVEVGGNDHATILWSDEAVEATVAWADSVFEPSAAQARTGDPRVGTSGLYLLCVLVLLAGVGAAAGRLGPVLEEASRVGVGRGLLTLAVAMLVAMPFTAAGSQAGFLSLAAGAAIVTPFAVAGALALGMRAVLGRSGREVPGWLGGGRLLWDEVRGTLGPALLAFVAVYVLLAPLGLVFHRLVPTPERVVAWVGASLLFLPFFVAFELLVRRGGAVAGTLLGIAGRVLVLVLLYAGVALGLLPGIVIIYVPILAALFVGFEVFAAAAYAAGRNAVLIAVVSSAWLGWITAVTLPVG